jgi:hypothetical protein
MDEQRQHPQDGGLVEPEGVNAGSARTEEEPREEAAGKVGDARGGGDPERRPQDPEDEDRHQDDLAGAAGTAPQDPSQVAAPPGQDSGSAR